MKLTFIPAALIMLLSFAISAFSQVLLKKEAVVTHDKWYKQYLNPRVIIAYVLFVVATVCTVISYTALPLSYDPIWNALGQVLSLIMCFIFLKERPNKKKLVGVGIILVGMIVFLL